MTQLESYLIAEYTKTKFTFFNHIEILIYFKKNFNVNVQDELDQMVKDKKIRYRPSFSGQLVELGRRLIELA